MMPMLAAADLDECNGHTTDAAGYHYHANSAAENQVIECLIGQTVAGAGDAGGGPGGPPPGGGSSETQPTFQAPSGNRSKSSRVGMSLTQRRENSVDLAAERADRFTRVAVGFELLVCRDGGIGIRNRCPVS